MPKERSGPFRRFRRIRVSTLNLDASRKALNSEFCILNPVIFAV
jgi:hypothetical protein